MPKPKSQPDGTPSRREPHKKEPASTAIVPDLPSVHIRDDALSRFRDAILERHTLAVTSMVDALSRRIECGALLYEARPLVRHKEWERWLTDNFSVETGLSVRTAQRYMQDYRQFLAFVTEHTPQDAGKTPPSAQITPERLIEFCREREEHDDHAQTERPDANDWISPQSLIEAVETVLGSLDCDPCAASTSHAAPLAPEQYTVKEDGLAADNTWTGKAWIAPGHQGDFSRWGLKAATEFDAGRLTDAILCLPVRPLQVPPRLQSCPIAISRSLLTVGYATTEGIQPRQLRVPLLFLYLSRQPHLEAFEHAFGDIAVVFGTARGGSNSVTTLSKPNKE